jgi:hypothetical protein
MQLRLTPSSRRCKEISRKKKISNIELHIQFESKNDVYLEEELYDILTYDIQNPNASDRESKKALDDMVESCMLKLVLIQWRICFIRLKVG